MKSSESAADRALVPSSTPTGGPEHILFPFNANVLGGSFVSTAIVIPQLRQLGGCRVSVSLPHPGVNTARFEAAGATVDHLGIPETYVSEVRQRRLRGQLGFHAHVHYLSLSYLRSSRPDIVHVNNDSDLLSWGLAAKRLGVPVVWHVRQERSNRLDPLFRGIADRLILIARSTAERFARDDLGSAVVAHNATDTTRFFPAGTREGAKAAVGLDPSKTIVGFAGRLRPVKRPEWALQAGIDALRAGHDVQVVIVGPDASGGRYDRELTDMIRASDLPPDSVKLLGHRDDMPDLMRAFDVFLLPSIAEPFGLVVTEAMASGAAVVATDAGGVPEIVRNGRNGLLVSSTDYAAFTAALDRLLREPELRNDLARAGYEDVRVRFTPEREAGDILRAYQGLA